MAQESKIMQLNNQILEQQIEHHKLLQNSNDQPKNGIERDTAQLIQGEQNFNVEEVQQQLSYYELQLKQSEKTHEIELQILRNQRDEEYFRLRQAVDQLQEAFSNSLTLPSNEMQLQISGGTDRFLVSSQLEFRPEDPAKLSWDQLFALCARQRKTIIKLKVKQRNCGHQRQIEQLNGEIQEYLKNSEKLQNMIGSMEAKFQQTVASYLQNENLLHTQIQFYEQELAFMRQQNLQLLDQIQDAATSAEDKEVIAQLEEAVDILKFQLEIEKKNVLFTKQQNEQILNFNQKQQLQSVSQKSIPPRNSTGSKAEIGALQQKNLQQRKVIENLQQELIDSQKEVQRLQSLIDHPTVTPIDLPGETEDGIVKLDLKNKYSFESANRFAKQQNTISSEVIQNDTEIEKLRAQVAQLQSQLSQKQQAPPQPQTSHRLQSICAARMSLAISDDEEMAAPQSLGKQSEQLEFLQNQLADIKEQHQKTQRQLTSATQSIQFKDGLIKQLEQERDELANKLAKYEQTDQQELAEALDLSLEQVQQQRTQIEQLTLKVHDITQEMQQEAVTYQAKVAKLNVDNSQLNVQNQQLLMQLAVQQNGASEELVNNLRTMLSQKDQQIFLMQEQMMKEKNEQQDAQKLLTSQIDALSIKCESLTKTVEELSLKEDPKSQKMKKNMSFSRAKSKESDFDSQIRSLQSQIEEKDRQISNQVGLIENLRKTIDKLQQQINIYKNQ